MRTVADEGVTIRLVRALRTRGTDLAPFPNAWKGLNNGALLAEIRAAGYSCILTCDQGLRYQQNLTRWQIGVIVLPWTRFEDLAPLISQIQFALSKIDAGSVRLVNRDGSLG